MIVCHCCRQYRIEEILLDRLDGAGERRWFRLLHLGYKIGDYRSLDELAEVLDSRGILMWPAEEDGCE